MKFPEDATFPKEATINERYRVLDYLGRGGAGEVYLCEQMGLGIVRAAKILSPRIDIDTDSSLKKEFKKTFLNEIRLLSNITHKNIVKIIDAGSASTRDGKDAIFLIMELVCWNKYTESPKPLSELVDNINTKKEFLDVIDDVLDGVGYLHSLNILHADLKPSNIMLGCQPNAHLVEVKIGDLGVSKLVSCKTSQPELPGINDTTMSEYTMIYGSERYAPEYAIEVMEKRRLISRAEDLPRYFPHLDLFYLGASLTEVFSENTIPRKTRNFEKLLSSPKAKILELFGEQDTSILRKIILRLVSENPIDCYESVVALRRDIAKLRAEYLQPLLVPEFSLCPPDTRITLPLSRIRITERVKKIVNHPMFQRLQNLSQLNLVALIYCGASHNRQLHSLAAFDMAREYASALLQNAQFRYIMNSEDFALLFVCALLHDIGQYPLAHAIEDFADSAGPSAIRGHLPSDKVLRDYQLTEFMLDRKIPGYGSIADILNNLWKISDLSLLIQILTKQTPKCEAGSIIQSMLDSAIDIDKATYLKYDSHYTGVPYGTGIDMTALLDSLTIIPVSGQRNTQMGIEIKGLTAAESLIVNRHNMFSRVYWHKTNRAIMAAIKYVVKQVLIGDERTLTFADYIEKTMFLSDMGALSLLSEEMNKFLGKISPSGLPYGNPVERIVRKNRVLPKRLLAISDRKYDSEGAQLFMGLGKCSVEQLETLRRGIIKDVLMKKHIVKLQYDSDVLLDVPRLSPEYDATKNLYVHVPGGQDGYVLLKSISHMVEAVEKNYSSNVKKARVFVSETIRDELTSSCRFENVRKDIYEYLRDNLPAR